MVGKGKHATKSALKVDDLSIQYDGKVVLDEVSITLNEGEIVGLIGLNGAGKTSLIKTILGLRAIQKGNISVLEQSHLSKQKNFKKQMAHLPERFSPPWFLTGIEFLKFSMDFYGRQVPEQKFKDAAETIALDPLYLGKRVHSYSKGMRQKLGLLATVMTQCRFVILDEPMSGLDPLARAHVKTFIRTYKTEDQTIFLSSHILEDMDDLCDRILVLHDSRIFYEGKPAELKKQQKEVVLEKAFLRLIER